MNSNWEKTKQASNYHFDPTITDPRWDAVVGVGKFAGDWSTEVADVIAKAKPSTWRSRGYAEENDVSPDIEAEENDLREAGAKEDLTICHMSWQFPKVFQKIVDLFCLTDPYTRIHTHLTGDTFTMHIDKLTKWCPEDPSKVMRFMVNLTDWEPGQIFQTGNFTYAKWKAGDVITFDWPNVPHGAANCSLKPRVVMIITGVATDATYAFLTKLKGMKDYNV